MKSYPGRKSVAYSGFVIPQTGELIVDKPSWFNYETAIASLRAFIKAYTVKAHQKLILILDNAPWHKKAMRLIRDDETYRDIRDAVTLVSLPPYSPDFNPIEQVWRFTRREKTHNRFWPTLQLLTDTLDQWFASFASPNETLRNLCSFGK